VAQDPDAEVPNGTTPMSAFTALTRTGSDTATDSPRRGRGRPKMGASLLLRERNKRWLLALIRGHATLEFICEYEDVSRWTVKRGVEDALTYREVLRHPEVQAWARSRGVKLRAASN
jgi:hypothetical protein